MEIKPFKIKVGSPQEVGCVVEALSVHDAIDWADLMKSYAFILTSPYLFYDNRSVYVTFMQKYFEGWDAPEITFKQFEEKYVKPLF